MDRQIVLNNNLVSYSEINRQAEKSAIIFLHGWRSSKAVWQGIVSQLRDINRPMYMLDLPGFGNSPATKSAFTISDYASLVKEFIKKQNLGRVALVGHSFGGRVGIRLGAMAPEVLEKLVLVDSAGFKTPQAKRIVFKAAAKLVRPVFKLNVFQGLRKKIYQSLGAEDYIATPQMQQTFIKVINEDLSADMQKITSPTLIVFGEKDTDTPPEFGQRMQKLIIGSRLEMLSSAGHYSFLDQPEKFCQLIRQFLQQ